MQKIAIISMLAITACKPSEYRMLDTKSINSTEIVTAYNSPANSGVLMAENNIINASAGTYAQQQPQIINVHAYNLIPKETIATETSTQFVDTAIVDTATVVTETKQDNINTILAVDEVKSSSSKTTLDDNSVRDGIYLGANLYESYYDNGQGDLSDNAGDGFGFKIGKHFNNHVRADVEYVDFSHDPDEIVANKEVDAIAAMANVYLETDSRRNLGAYIGAGTGIANVRENDSSNTDSYLALQGMAGVTYNITNGTALEAGYKYFEAGNTSFESSLPDTDDKYKTHNLGVGVRVGF